jgi:hypothetical protein
MGRDRRLAWRAPSHEQRQADVLFGQVSEGRMAQLVKGPSTGRLPEWCLGARIAQSGTAGLGAAVDGGGARAGAGARSARNSGT